MSSITPEQASEVLSRADCLYTRIEVEAALDRMAESMNHELNRATPVFVCVMTGGTVPFVQLAMRFEHPCEFDYVHATRYEGELSGGKLRWVSGPNISPQGRTVVLIDDILDEGNTLTEIKNKYEELGAARIYTAVLVVKDRSRQIEVEIDYKGLDVPDRYVFGYGMDYKGYLRNVPGIYAEARGQK